MRSSRAFYVATSVTVALTLLAACGANNPPAPPGPPASTLRREPTARAGASTEESVAFQVNTEHTGAVKHGLRLPLKVLWSTNPDGSKPVGYPVVNNGIVVVAADSDLIGLNSSNGTRIWREGSPSGYAWVGPAYDNGMIFASPREQSSTNYAGMYAFDQSTGTPIWSAPAPGQVFFSSAPTAAYGAVYTAGYGIGGTVYAYNESSGALKWTASVGNGDDSSPAVTSKGVYVSYECPQTYDFKPRNGKQIWHYGGYCSGGGGSTPVLYHGLLFVGESDTLTGYNGLILTAKTGKVVGGFNSYYTPAFSGKLGYFTPTLGYTFSLEARKVTSMALAWKVTLKSDSYVTPPLVAGNIVYIVTAGGFLLGYDAKSGKQKVNLNLGSAGSYRGFSVGLGYGSNELIVPNGQYLIAIGGS